MRHSVVIAGICVLVAGCATTSNATSSTPTRSMVPRPLVERELPVLLLSPEEAAATMGSTPMTVTSAQTAMSDSSQIMEPAECLAIDAAAEALVYADSGFVAERDESLNNGNDFTHYLKQAVVLYPYAEKAAEFFDRSVAQWPECHAYSHTQSGSQWTVNEISNVDGILSTTATMSDAKAPGWGCGRALALRNNVIVDVNTCSADPGDSAVRIAQQIGEKVLAQW
ncbi:sensor domain-containing protein [Mycolicibacterium sp. S2-37]|uniref:sensor domain-containing protein n=1 Tax=Mycolicibacterium sp. S2-37 TaxID=2810297 RepID=UPI001A94B0FD|nr:sensor domain-containing protein [Mycolicibacterium sp. S2-37]MBO0676344.1 sensor domain-containing protein [Mycolicibacterium sp. S2-37]